MKKKILTVFVALIAALAVVCFAAAVSEEPEDVKKDTIVDDTEIDPVVTTGVVTETDATVTDATETDAPETDATATDATATDATATDATATDATATDATATDARRLGDVDGDGKIKPEDARLALRASVHLEKYAEDSDEFFAADINANGVIEPEDARKILLASVNLFDLNDPLATPTDPEPEEEEEPATPTDATPTDATPTDATPTDATPTDATSTDATPTDATPSDADDDTMMIAAKMYLMYNDSGNVACIAGKDGFVYIGVSTATRPGTGDGFDVVGYRSDPSVENGNGITVRRPVASDNVSALPKLDLDAVRALAAELSSAE